MSDDFSRKWGCSELNELPAVCKATFSESFVTWPGKGNTTVYKYFALIKFLTYIFIVNVVYTHMLSVSACPFMPSLRQHIKNYNSQVFQYSQAKELSGITEFLQAKDKYSFR